MTVTCDLLGEALTVTRRHIDAAPTIRGRLRALWAGAKHARRLGAADVVVEEFVRLGEQAGLDRGVNAAADLRHVIGWACRDMDPFGRVS